MISEKIKTAEGIEGARRATEISSAGASVQGSRFMQSLPPKPPDPEVSEKAVRRHFTAEYKIQVLHQADACRGEEGIGALLRREGLYSSHLTTWRRQRDAGILSALKPKKRGRKIDPVHPLQDENAKLRKENLRLQKRLKKAELIIDIQKKISQMLGIPMETSGIEEED
jgi:transposase